MSDQGDLGAFRDAWIAQRDFLTGRRYIESLEANGSTETALEVCAEMWDLGYPSGRFDAAWIVKDRGDITDAIDLMTEALTRFEPEHISLARGVLGHWRWHYFNDQAAEPELRAGMYAYGTARADLAHLLIATGRENEARQVLQDGTRQDVVECMLPLANLLAYDGDRSGAEALYRRAAQLGDGNSAWSLGALLLEDGRDDEAAEWQWKAAEMGDEVAIQFLADPESYEE